MEEALSRRKEASSDKYKPYLTGPPGMISTSLTEQKEIRNDMEQALSRLKGARSDKYKPYHTGLPGRIRTSLIKSE